MGLAGAMALGGLKKTSDDRNLDAAGLLKLLDGQKDQIAEAIPADVARRLEGTAILPAGLLSAAATPRAAEPARPVPKPAPKPAPAPASSGGGIWRWVAGLAVLAVALWLLSQWFSGPAETPVADAPAEAASEVATGPLVVDGVDLGAAAEGVLASLTGTLAGVTDVTSAETAVAALTEADSSLATLQETAAGLGDEGRTALQSLIAGALPTLRGSADALLADTGIGPILAPVLDSIFARLTALAG